MRTVPIVIQAVHDNNISVMLVETDGDDDTALTLAAQKVITDYAECDLGELEMSEIEGHHTPWRVAYVQNKEGQIEKLSVAQFWT